MKSNNTSISSSTLSAAPSITASRISTNNINNDSFKQNKLNLSFSQSVHFVQSTENSIRSPGISSQDTQASSANLDRDKDSDKVEDLLEKAKFYTSLCLGK